MGYKHPKLALKWKLNQGGFTFPVTQVKSEDGAFL